MKERKRQRATETERDRRTGQRVRQADREEQADGKTERQTGRQRRKITFHKLFSLNFASSEFGARRFNFQTAPFKKTKNRNKDNGTDHFDSAKTKEKRD